MGKQVGISVDTTSESVIVAFEEPMEWIELSPRQAVELAEAIVRKAMTLNDRGSNIIIPEVLNS